VFLDDDATVLPFTLAETARLFEHEEVGAVGAPLRGTSAGENQFPGNRFLHPWFVPVPGPAGPGVSSAPRTVQGRGAYLAVRRSLFQELNGFDRCLYPYGGEDFDLCWKVWMSGSEVALIEGAVLHRGFGDNPKLVPAERIARNLSDNVANYLMIYLKNSSRTTLVQFPLIAGWILSFPVRCGASRASVLGVRKAFRRIEESGGLTKLRRESQRVRARTDLGITRLFRGAGQGRSGALGGRR
jgi:GT2 family glycosyltransferase